MTFFHCKFCPYFSDRKFNLRQHIARKHIEKNRKCENDYFEEKHIHFEGKHIHSEEKHIHSEEKHILAFICSKCNKIYKTKKYLEQHQKICKYIDSHTCPRCMKTFSNTSNKSKHIKKNKCVARSIIHANTPNNKNIQNITNINNIDNSMNKTINNIHINNFGSERIDHITHEDIVKMLISGMNTIPLYIEKKHFDKDFPENNNITFTNENKCKVLEDNLWKEKDIGLLSSKLIHDNSEVLLLYCDDNELKLSNVIQDEEKYKFIKDKLFIVYDKSDNKKYNSVLSKIKDLIKNSQL